VPDGSPQNVDTSAYKHRKSVNTTSKAEQKHRNAPYFQRHAVR
jgi:hypothetical protein